MQKTDSQGTLKFIYDGTRYGAKMIAATNASNQIQVTYDYGLGLVRQKTAAGARSYYHSDGLGSTSRLTDASENVTDSFKYEAWGNLLSHTGTTQTPFQFVGGSGYYSDTDSGLMMLGARYYSSGVGRFISRDPLMANLNWYAYAANNPVNRLDPSGEVSIWVIITVFCVVTTVVCIGFLLDMSNMCRSAPTAMGFLACAEAYADALPFLLRYLFYASCAGFIACLMVFLYKWMAIGTPVLIAIVVLPGLGESSDPLLPIDAYW